MTIRKYRQEDLPVLKELFRGSVFGTGEYYTQEQLAAWANADFSGWHASLSQNDARVAEIEGIAVGFADMTPQGYLDRLYVRADCFRRGVGTALCDALESACPAAEFTVYASEMAKAFFEGRGYRVVRGNTAVRGGVALKNYFMSKPRA